MLEHDSRHETAVQIDFAAIGLELDNIAYEIDDHEGGVRDYFEAPVRDLITVPLGKQMLDSAESLVCDWLPSVTFGRGVAFVYGAVCTYLAIDRIDRSVADKIYSYDLELPTLVDVFDCEPELQVGQVMSQACNGLQVLGGEETLSNLKEVLIENTDFQSYVPIGVGWMAYQAIVYSRGDSI